MSRKVPKIIIASRQEAMAAMKVNLHGRKIAIISISDPDIEYPFFHNPDIVDVVYTKFWDTEREYPPIYPATRDDVKEIKPFIDKNKDKVDVILIHCHAGISRSAAVAAAVSEYLGIEHNIFFDGEHNPNYHVYKLMCDEFGISKTQEYYDSLFQAHEESLMNTYNDEVEL